jgi:hypothetical protein
MKLNIVPKALDGKCEQFSNNLPLNKLVALSCSITVYNISHFVIFELKSEYKHLKWQDTDFEHHKTQA